MTQLLLDLTASYRENLEFERALTFDAAGKEIFAGLTREESEWLARHRQRGLRPATREDKRRAMDLQTRNDLARGKGILGAHEAISAARPKP
jgi:hypothetical protein